MVTHSERSSTRSAVTYPLSPGQYGIWLAEIMSNGVPFNIAQYLEIRGSLDVELFVRAGQRAEAEMEFERLRLVEIDGYPHLRLEGPNSHEEVVLDFRGESDPVRAAMEWMRADFGKPIDLLHDKLSESKLFRLADEHYFWYSRAHHVVLDGLGGLNVTRRTAELYTASVEGRTPSELATVSLEKLYRAEHEYRESRRFTADREYWADHVADLPAPASLTRKVAPPAAYDLVSGEELSAASAARLEELTHRTGQSAAQVVVAAIAAFLSKTTESPDVVLTLPVTGRTTSGTKRAAGMFANLLPLRFRLSARTTIEELIAESAHEMLGALRHQRYRFEDIRRDANMLDNVYGTFGPVMNLLLFDSELKFGEATAKYHILRSGRLEDLQVNIHGSGSDSDLTIDFHGNPNRYDQKELDRIRARFVSFFGRFLAAPPNTEIWRLSLLDAAERQLVVQTWNDTEHRVNSGATVVSLFHEQVMRTPDAPAVVFAGESLSYSQLASRVRRLARVLIEHGAGPETAVAVAIRRSAHMVIGIYAVLETGAAYVPIDPEQPLDRVAYICETVNAACVLAGHADDASIVGLGSVVFVDDDLARMPDGPVTDVERLGRLHPDNTAYVLFTSGSTGQPKGVAVSHRSVGNQILWLVQQFKIGPADKILLKTAVTFDVSVWELFAPLISGARIVVAIPDGQRDPTYLAREIDQQSVTMLSFVPSMLGPFVSALENGASGSLRAILVAGEAFPISLAEPVAEKLPHAELHNLYGPTEFTVHATASVVHPGTSVPIGVPVWNSVAL
ncbi:AMP-binding protein, partial [Aldersonia sp. NBC_00410]|uniref:AMP-binding protein n=1 Tax=Aldersonia sp. NBC_00410 TaxID=2975954 RepID=UPI0022518A02